MRHLEVTTAEAELLLSDGTPGAADNLLWRVLAKNPRDDKAWDLLSRIAAMVGAEDFAHDFAAVGAGLRGEPVPSGASAPLPTPPADDRYLVIKAWGSGFCSELDHTVGGFLLAEMTGRTPVTHWGGDSLYTVDPRRDAFREYFEPVSSVTLEDVIARTTDADFWPPKWNRANLHTDKHTKAAPTLKAAECGCSRMAAIQFLHRPERVLVSDYHIAVVSLVPWIRRGHPMHGRDTEAVLRYLFAKYIRPQPDLRARIQAFAAEHFRSRPIIAVHIRGSDKYKEEAHLAQRQAMYPQAIDRLAQMAQAGTGSAAPSCPIFLITDSKPLASEYQKRYGARLILPPAVRTDSQVGVHLMGHPDRGLLGEEIVRDIYLAAMCDMFVGMGSSNVAATIHHLKRWSPGSEIHLAGIMTHSEDPNMYMHLEQMERYLGPEWGAKMRAAGA
jgi:protein O-GlcNAc transferase